MNFKFQNHNFSSTLHNKTTHNKNIIIIRKILGIYKYAFREKKTKSR